MCLYAFIYICIQPSVRTLWTNGNLWLYGSIYMYSYIYVLIYIYTYTFTYMHIYVFSYIYIRVFTCTCTDFCPYISIQEKPVIVTLLCFSFLSTPTQGARSFFKRSLHSLHSLKVTCGCRVATISRLLEIIGLFCRI